MRIQLPELGELVSVDEMDRLLSEYLLPAPWSLQAEGESDGKIQFVVRRPDMVWSAGRSSMRNDPA